MGAETPVPRTRQSRYDVLTKTMVPATAATRKNSDFGDGVDDFHIKWFAGILQGLDPQLAEGFKGAIEEVCSPAPLHIHLFLPIRCPNSVPMCPLPCTH